jgi:hypothetical protein
MRTLLLPVLALLSFTVSAQQVKEKKIRKYAETIKEEELRKKLTIIAGPEMEGRATTTPGQRKAAAYIESQFKKIGLKPGNGNSYQQFYDIYKDSLVSSSLSVNGRTFNQTKDYTASVNNGFNGTAAIDKLVFVKSGILTESADDYKDLDVKNKWVLVNLGNSSTFLTRRLLANARFKGAKGVVFISARFPARETSALSSLYINRRTTIPSVTVSYNVASEIFGKTVDTTALKTEPAQELKTNFSFTANKEKITYQASNVIGLLPAKKPSDEYMFITAHYDHLGGNDTTIYYGADDDGSGTVGVIELAEAFAKAAKKGDGANRNIVFMTVSGEENGLLGSEYYSEHPIFPMEKTSVDLNMDMIGRIDPKYKGDSMNYTFIIGEDQISSELITITDSINKHLVGLEIDRRFNDVKDPNRYYSRSDHYNFAKKGVPILFYFDGDHPDYHRPTDTVDKITFSLYAKRVKLVFYTAWVMSHKDEMLKRDRPMTYPPRM